MKNRMRKRKRYQGKLRDNVVIVDETQRLHVELRKVRREVGVT